MYSDSSSRYFGEDVLLFNVLLLTMSVNTVKIRHSSVTAHQNFSDKRMKFCIVMLGTNEFDRIQFYELKSYLISHVKSMLFYGSRIKKKRDDSCCECILKVLSHRQTN